MFSRLVFLSSCLAVLLCALFVQAAPIESSKRQIGDLQCNINRGEIVAAIAEMQGTVNGLASQVASDPANAAAVSSAQGGIKQAEGAIANIAAAILTGQQAPATDRDNVEAGLDAVGSALGNITSTDTAVTSQVSTAQAQLQKAAAAGDGVLANCN